MKGALCILMTICALSTIVSQSFASDQAIDEKSRSAVQSLLSGEIHAYSTGHLSDIVWAFRAKRISVSDVRMNCDGLAVTIEVWGTEENHYLYSVTMPMNVNLANNKGNDEFFARCDISDCMNTKLSVTSATGQSDKEQAVTFLQIITEGDEARRAMRAFQAVRESCAGTTD